MLFLYNVPIRQDVMVTGPGIQEMITVWNDRREGDGIFILQNTAYAFVPELPFPLTARQAQMSDTVPSLPAAAQFWRKRSMDS